MLFSWSFRVFIGALSVCSVLLGFIDFQVFRFLVVVSPMVLPNTSGNASVPMCCHVDSKRMSRVVPPEEYYTKSD